MSASDGGVSTNNIEAEAANVMCCASCGTAAVDDIQLKKCTNCDLVRYCSDKCQQEHLPKHEATCKERNAELRDEILFRQPECTHHGDCPICFLPLSLYPGNSILTQCCSKVMCNGCNYANIIREREINLQNTCPFCRHPVPKSKEEANLNRMKRVEKNDPFALQKMGGNLYDEGDYESSFEYLTKAVELGDVGAHYLLAKLYRKGEGVEKDEKKEIHHLEEAAIGGHVGARGALAYYEWRNERIDREVKHLIIAANLGYDKSIQRLKECYVNGDVSKEDFATALRAHQAAADAMKSPQREAAAKAIAAGELRFV